MTNPIATSVSRAIQSPIAKPVIGTSYHDYWGNDREHTTTYTIEVDGNFNPDTYVAKSKDSYIIPSTLIQVVGKKGGKGTVDHALFVRFEIGVPYGSTILGVKIEWAASGTFSTTGGTSMNITGGWIIPQTGSYQWQGDDAVGEWNNDTANIPFAEWDSGDEDDLTVFQGGAPAFSSVSSVIVTTQYDLWSVGEGITAETTVTGLVNQLQSYLDTYDELYNGGSIPAMFQLYRPYTTTADHYQGLYPADWGAAEHRPKLTVHYVSP